MSDEEVVEPKKPKKRGVRGFARKNVVVKDNAVSGFYTESLKKCFNKLSEVQQAVIQNEELDADIEDDLLARCKRSEPLQTCTISDEEDSCKDASDSSRNSPEANANTNTVTSPSPPPPPSPPQGALRKKRTRASKQKKKLLNAINDFTQSSSDAQELLISQELEMPEPEVCLLVEDEVTVRLDLRGNIHRYTVSQDEPFSHIVSRIAKAEGVLEKQVMLVLNDKTVRHDDTPTSVSLQVADIIGCHIVESCDDSLNTSHEVPSDDHIELVLQSKSSKHREVVQVHRGKPLSRMMEEYASRVGKDQSCLQFMFDGDEIAPEETPDMLDMEDGDILDVIEGQRAGIKASKTNFLYGDVITLM